MRLVAVLLATILSSALSAEDPSVEIAQGKLSGKAYKSAFKRRVYNSFKGIPYAQPPIGKLRFRPPVKHQGWDGVWDAKKHKSECVQIDIVHEDKAHGSEDCLYLNVYTPFTKKQLSDDQKPMPVMVWIHGNYYHAGSSNIDLYGPQHFMDEDVVLVTIDYRLGVLGFLDLEDDVIAGNQGLKDMVMSLEWVRDNVGEFGGDPDSVTLFGSNAGSVSIDLLLLTPWAKGLFHKAIMQSGVSLMSVYLDWGRLKRAIKLSEVMGKPSERQRDLAKIFSETDALDFPINASRTISVEETLDKQCGVLPFSATVNLNGDLAFITKTPEEIFKSGTVENPDVTIMLGYNSQESIYKERYTVARPPFLGQTNKRFNYLLPLRGPYTKYKSYYYSEISARLKMFYFTNGTLDPYSAHSMDEYLNWQSDLTVYPVDRTVRAYLNSSSAPVYYYRFSYEGSLNHYKSISTEAVLHDSDTVRVRGASERDELCYLFRCGRIRKTYEEVDRNPESSDALAVRRIVRLWTNFARTGNPTPLDEVDDLLGGVKWEPAKKDQMNFLDIDRELKTGVDPFKERIEFWDAMYEHYNALAEWNHMHDKEVKDEL